MAVLNNETDDWLYWGKMDEPEPNDVLKDFQFDFTPHSPASLDRVLFDRWSPRVIAWTERLLKTSDPLWDLDLDMLADALDHLGINWELEITAMPIPGSVAAHHGALIPDDALSIEDCLPLEDQLHVVTLDPGLGPQAASYCLWHELTHCAQAERFESPYDFFMTLMGSRGGIRPGSLEYYNTWWEAEAFKNMKLHDEIGSLTRPA